MDFKEAVNQQICKIASTLDKILEVDEAREKRDTDIVFIAIPEDATPSVGTRSFAVGTTKIDFRTGVIQNPDGTLEYLNTKLNSYHLDWLHSLSVDSDQDITIKLEGKPKRTISASFSTQIPYLTYYSLEITCSVITNIQVFACTNPAAVIGQFKQTTITVYEQESVNGDTVEAQTWDAVVNLKNNLNRIRNQIVAITGEAWGTVSHSIATVWGKFHATTGHKHTGGADDAPKIPDTSLESPVATHAALSASVHGVSALGFEDKANKAAASGYPSLNASSKVVQDPANATATPTASKIPIADESGKLDGWVSSALPSFFGDGIDGDVTISSNTTLSADMDYNNLTINASISLNTGGYTIRVKNTLTVNGTIHRNGNNGNNGGSGVGGTGGTALSDVTFGGSGAGGTGSASGVPGTAGTGVTGFGGNGGAGGPSNITGEGATAGGTTTLKKMVSPFELLDLILNITNRRGGSGGGGGDNGGTGMGGGGGGSGGGVVVIMAKTILVNSGGIISANGGMGGNGGTYSGTIYGGGGGGGGGGAMILIYSSLTNNGTVSASGGIGGTGYNAVKGMSGNNGKNVLYQA